MNEWLRAFRRKGYDPDPEILEESALAMAQATIQGAITTSGISRAELSRRMGRSRSFVTRMLRGDHNLTVRTMARALTACGYEPRFSYQTIEWGWSRSEPRLIVVECEGRVDSPLCCEGQEPLAA
jgi:transcriptional regulator with XRE-family HTH domain